MAGRLRALRRHAKSRGSTSRSRTPRTSCRSWRARSASHLRTRSTTSSPASSTASAVGRPDESSFPTRSHSSGSTGSEHRLRRCVGYPGLKEEYYLHGFEPDPSVIVDLGLDHVRVLVVVRTPPDVSLYHRHGNPLLTDVLERLGRDPGVQAVVLPRTPEQRQAIAALSLPSLVLPENAVDAQSLVALSDLVVSAGGTMNREAVALGYLSTRLSPEQLGAVDDALIAEGRSSCCARQTSPLEKRLRRSPAPAVILRCCSI